MSEHPDDLLAEYLDGTLAEGDRAAVEAHVSGCDRCRAELREAGVARTELRAVPAAEPPPGLADDVIAAARAERPASATVTEFASGRSGKRPASAWLAGAAAVAAVLIGVFVLKGLGGNAPAPTAAAVGARTGPEITGPSGPVSVAPRTHGVVLQPGENYDAAGIERLAADAANGQVPVPPGSLASPSVAATATRCLTKGAELQGDERPVELLQARFSGKPADLGVYRVPGASGGPDRIVVWVVARNDCSVLSFTQHLLSG